MPAATPPRPSRHVATAAVVLCLLAVAAAVVSFVQGNWLGIVWVLLAGVTSNMAWYHARRARALRENTTGGVDGDVGAGAADVNASG